MSVPPPSSPPRRGVAAVIAMLALVVAVFAAFMSAWALKKANDSADTADRLATRANQLVQPTPQPSGPGADPALTTAPTDTTEPTDAPTDSTTSTAEVSLDPQQVWDTKYAPRDLTVQVTRWRSVDLDAPVVDDEAGMDIQLQDVIGLAVKIAFGDGVTVAKASSDAISPYDCSQRMLYSPLDATTSANFRKGESFCVRTSRQAAVQRSESQQMAVVTVKDISLGGTVVLTTRAWKVPG